MLYPLAYLFAIVVSVAQGQDLCPVPNNFSYHSEAPQTIRSFQGIYHSNYNETITFCNFKAKFFELNEWSIIPTLAQTGYGGPPYTDVGAVLTGAVYVAGNGSIIWQGFGFSASGPYDCAFALSANGSNANGYYTYTDQRNGSSEAGDTGPWELTFQRAPTWAECQLVYRAYTVQDFETGCTSSG